MDIPSAYVSTVNNQQKRKKEDKKMEHQYIDGCYIYMYHPEDKNKPYLIVTLGEKNAYVVVRNEHVITWQKAMNVDNALKLLCEYEDKGYKEIPSNEKWRYPLYK